MEIQPSTQPSGSQPATKPVPLGAKIISVLYYIVSVFQIFGGILILMGSSFFGAALMKNLPLVGFFGSTLFGLVGLIVLALGVLFFFIGRGLWSGKNWARVAAIVLACLGILSALNSMFKGHGGLPSLVIDAIIAGYLWFDKSVKEVFA